MAFANGQLYVTDNKAGATARATWYAVNPTTGVAQSLISGIDAIEDVAIASDGRIYVTDAAGIDYGANQLIGKGSGKPAMTPHRADTTAA